jgi:hypothetical protein
MKKKTVDLHGRPTKPFSHLSERSKIQKVKPLVETISPDRLLWTTRVSLFKEGFLNNRELSQHIERK